MEDALLHLLNIRKPQIQVQDLVELRAERRQSDCLLGD